MRLSSIDTLKAPNIGDCLVDQFAKGDERFLGAQGRSSRHVRPRRWQLILRRSRNGRSACACADLADATAIHAEPCRDIVLPIASRDHAFGDRDFIIRQCHARSSLFRAEACQLAVAEAR